VRRIFRGVLLYRASGDGKCSLINASLLPAVARAVQPDPALAKAVASSHSTTFVHRSGDFQVVGSGWVDVL